MADARARDAAVQERGEGMTVDERDRHNLLEHIDDLEQEAKLLRRLAASYRRRVQIGMKYAVGKQ